MNLISQHPAVEAIALYWAYSALVGGMPEPDQTSSFAYRWAYSSLHILSGDIRNAVATRFPNAIPNIPAGSTVTVASGESTTITKP